MQAPCGSPQHSSQRTSQVLLCPHCRCHLAPLALAAAAASSLITAVVPLDCSLPATLKGKILSNEYVHFGQLLYPSNSCDYSVNVVNNTMQLSALPKNNGKYSIDQWSQAYSIFCAVYLKKYLNQAISLLKYGQTTRELARQYFLFAWRQYMTRHLGRPDPPCYGHVTAYRMKSISKLCYRP